MKLKQILKYILSLLITTQAITPGYITGMDKLNNTWQSVKTVSTDFYNNPIKNTAKGAANAAKYTAPFAIPAAAAYDVLWSDIMPNWISWPVASITTYLGYQAVKDTPTFKAIASKTNQGLAQAGEGLNEAGVNVDAIVSTAQNVGQKAVQLTGTILQNPINYGYEKLKAGYIKVASEALNIPKEEVSFAAIGNKLKETLAREVVGAAKQQAAQELRHTLEIPEDEDITAPRVMSRVREITGEQAATATRDTLGIPADQPVDAASIAQRVNNAAYKSLWKFGSSAAVLTAAAPIAVITAWLGGKYLLHKAMQKPEPKVFRSTSEKSRWERFKNWSLNRTEHFPEMIYSADLEVRLNNITKATININGKINEGKTNVFYRNVLLEGPPGTGKTYFARNMVRRASEATDGRMKWRETDGSALLKGGIPAIDEMFEWAENQTGVCIFIDEADTLFGDRDKLNLNDEQVIVLNHLLNRLGDRSNKYMIIMATNRKIVFDAAMQRRIDDLIEIPLPAQNERARVLQLYRNTILLDEKENNTEFIASAQTYLGDDKIKTIAQGTEGLSNGDLQGIMTTIKSESDITDNGLVTNAIVDEVVQRYIDKNQSMNMAKIQPKVTVAQPNNTRRARRK